MNALEDGTSSQTFINEGLALQDDGSLLVDLNQPRAILVRGYDPLTRLCKHYMLRVTKAGKLHLV